MDIIYFGMNAIQVVFMLIMIVITLSLFSSKNFKSVFSKSFAFYAYAAELFIWTVLLFFIKGKSGSEYALIEINLYFLSFINVVSLSLIISAIAFKDDKVISAIIGGFFAITSAWAIYYFFGI